MMRVYNVSSEGEVCAVVTDDKIAVYNIVENITLFQEKKETDVKIKNLKVSPGKNVVVWLQSTTNDLFAVNLNSRNIVKIKSHIYFPFHKLLWSPSGKYLAAFSSLSIFTDIFEIKEGNASKIVTLSGAKYNNGGDPVAQFSPGGEYFASVNICNQGYSMTIYTTLEWDCVQNVFVRDVHDVAGLQWCHDSASLLLWETGLEQLKLQLWAIDGQKEHEMTAEAASISCVCLTACGRMAALFSFDSRVRIIDLLTWQMGITGTLFHCPIVHKSSARSRLKESANSSDSVTLCQPVTDILLQLFHDSSRSDQSRLIQFSCDAQFLATYEPTYPSTLWIWNLIADIPLDTVVSLIDGTYVSDLVWHKEETVLAGSLSWGKVLVWTPCQVPKIVQNKHSVPYPLTSQTYFTYYH